MATKIKRCLFIGLGGTGMNALLRTKKMFVDTYGEVPPMIGFLGLDTDGGAYKKELDSVYGTVKLTPNEQMPIFVEDARPIYEVSKEHFAWLPERNLYALSSMTLGAGQVRTNGRFAFTVNYKSVENKVRSILDSITAATISTNPKYELLGNNVEIHMAFSVCGGTGCGTFLNMAYLLKDVAPQCKLTGYGVLADVFEAMNPAVMAKVKPNAFGAIQDLDWLMHLGIGSERVSFDYITSVKSSNDRPFNAFYFIDNKNQNGDTYAHIDNLADMLSLAFVTSSGELSTASASVTDNLEKNIREGVMNIRNKKAWVAGLGICEIIYHNKDLQRIYELKAVKRTIERLLNSCVDTDTIVNAWIDSPEINIRENNGQDKVIDYILKKEPNPLDAINDLTNARPEIDQYVLSTLPKDVEITTKLQALINRVDVGLKNLLVEEINKECGVHAAEYIILGIIAQVDIFLGEMRQELNALKENQPRIISALDINISQLSEYNSKFLKTKSNLENYKNDVIEVAMNLAMNKREIIRRDAAITFYTDLKNKLYNANTKITNIKNALHAIISKCTQDLSMIQNRIGRNTQTFQIDLATNTINSVSIDDVDIQIPDFIKMLTSVNGIYDFDTMHSDELYSTFQNYSSSLNKSRKYGNVTIDEVIDKMTEQDFNQLINDAVTKSMPLFRYSYKGHTPAQMPALCYYIGVPDKLQSRLNKEDYFKNHLQNQGSVTVDFANIGMDDRIIIYCQLGVLPAYAISALSTYKEKYERCMDENCHCHFDLSIYNKMQRDNYDLEPAASVDDTLELWVKGLVFGLIKNENGNYYLYSEQLGDSLDDYWFKLNQYRDEAFQEFKRHKSDVRSDFNRKFTELQKTRGTEAMQQIVNDAKANYLDKYSQVNMTRDEIKARGNETIAKLIREEIDYIKRL